MIIVVVRHGQYIGFADGPLSITGNEKVRELGEVLAQDLKGMKVAMLCSPKQRTVNTRDSLSTFLNSGHLEVLESLDMGCCASELNAHSSKTLARIEELSSEYDAVVLVSHSDYVSLFPTVWAETVKKTVVYPEYPIPFASARVIDTETGEVKFIKSCVTA
jgi:phosphohistidine phosphatase SixA